MSGSAQIHPSVPAGIRLTRRGRVVVVCAAAFVLLAGLWLGARHGAGAASGGGPAAPAPESVVVGPHDTLWGIAVRTRPGVDPRITVQRMIDLNALSGAIVNPGQRVLLPSR
jgi:hypothetical protein